MKVDKFHFPSGEMQVSVSDLPQNNGWANVWLDFKGDSSIIELLLQCDSIKRQGYRLDNLYMDYVPFSRQDRIMNTGEAFSLKIFCDLINDLNFREVHITDPHSDVTPALLNNCVVLHQWNLFAPIINKEFSGTPYWLVCPDGGALKKIYKLAELTTPKGVIECSKKRDVTNGQITGVKVHTEGHIIDWVKDTMIVVDDIIEGGRTYIEIAKEINNKYFAGELVLMASHGFFSKGLDVLSDYDQIWTRSGRVK